MLSEVYIKVVSYSREFGLLVVTYSALLDDMSDSLAVADAAGVYATIDRVVEAGHDPRRFAADLLDRFRDLIVLDAVPDAVEKGLIDYAGDQAMRMADQARRIGVASLVRFADITHTTLTDMRGTTSPRLMLELLSARMLLPDAASDSAALLQRLERLERRQGLVATPAARPESPAAKTGQPAARAERPVPQADQPVSRPEQPAAKAEPPAAKAEPPAAKAEPPAAKAEPPAAKAEPPAAKAEPPAAKAEPPAAESDQPTADHQPTADDVPVAEHQPGPVTDADLAWSDQPIAAAAVPPVQAAPDSNALRQLWPEVMAALRERSKVKWAMMNEVVIASVDGDAVSLLAPAGLARRIADESNLTVLREVLQSVVFGHWKLTVTAAGPVNGSAAVPAEEPPADPEPEPAPRAARPARPARPEPAAPPPRAVADDDGVDEDSDEVHGSQRAGGDAEAAAIELLQTSLGARPIDAP